MSHWSFVPQWFPKRYILSGTESSLHTEGKQPLQMKISSLTDETKCTSAGIFASSKQISSDLLLNLQFID